jgi:hypothetical protein
VNEMTSVVDGEVNIRNIICDIWFYFFKRGLDVFEISFNVHNGRRWLGIFCNLTNRT